MQQSPKQQETVLCFQISSESTQPYNDYLASTPFHSSFINSKILTPQQRSTRKQHSPPSNNQIQEQQQTFSRATLQYNNRKQRIVRSAHYRHASSQPHFYQQQVSREAEPCSIRGKSMKILESNSSKQRKKVHSALTSRSQTRLSDRNNYLSPVDLKERIRSHLCSAYTSKSSSSAQFFDLSQKHPHVIYPFESKLKIKRVDDNPKILQQVIAKKNKILQKHQLYAYINKLINRRIS